MSESRTRKRRSPSRCLAPNSLLAFERHTVASIGTASSDSISLDLRRVSKLFRRLGCDALPHSLPRPACAWQSNQRPQRERRKLRTRRASKEKKNWTIENARGGTRQSFGIANRDQMDASGVLPSRRGPAYTAYEGCRIPGRTTPPPVSRLRANNIWVTRSLVGNVGFR